MAFLFLLAVAASLDAPSTPPESAALSDAAPSDIVVEGRKDRNKRIQKFVDAVTVARIGGELSRFNDKVCPAAVGLTEVQNELVVNRLRAVANAAGMKVAGPGCMASALVAVVDDKEAFLSALRKRYPSYFQNALGEPIATPREPGPATAWHVESILDADGLKPTLLRNPETGAKHFELESMESGRVKPMSRPHFVAGTLVVERSALGGLTTTQLADYAAMRLYVRTRPARMRDSSAPTILSVLEAPFGSQVPITITAWDLAVLRSLYSTDPMQFATQQRAAIVAEVKKALNGEKAPKN